MVKLFAMIQIIKESLSIAHIFQIELELCPNYLVQFTT